MQYIVVQYTIYSKNVQREREIRLAEELEFSVNIAYFDEEIRTELVEANGSGSRPLSKRFSQEPLNRMDLFAKML